MVAEEAPLTPIAPLRHLMGSPMATTLARRGVDPCPPRIEGSRQKALLYPPIAL